MMVSLLTHISVTRPRWAKKITRHLRTVRDLSRFDEIRNQKSEIVYSIDIHRIHLQIKLHNTITHTHVNRWWYMESPQCHRRSKVANPIAPPSPAAPPAVIKQLRAPPATTKAARSATVPLSGHGQVVSFTSLKLCNRYHILLHAMYSR